MLAKLKLEIALKTIIAQTGWKVSLVAFTNMNFSLFWATLLECFISCWEVGFWQFWWVLLSFCHICIQYFERRYRQVEIYCSSFNLLL